MDEDLTMKKYTFLIIIILSQSAIFQKNATAQTNAKVQTNTIAQNCVILLHGLMRSDASMSRLDEYLQKNHYFTINLDYPSNKQTIQNLSKNYIKPALEQCPKDSKVHFVTHSMGGILVRHYIHDHKIHNLGRVVMLGPPNQGSELIDKLKKLPTFEWIHGPAGLELSTDVNSTPISLGAADFELGIIAGKYSVNPILSTMIPGKDDGKVSVERTKVDGMQDHIIMPTTHPFMMRNKKVMEQVVSFLETGKFTR